MKKKLTDEQYLSEIEKRKNTIGGKIYADLCFQEALQSSLISAKKREVASFDASFVDSVAASHEVDLVYGTCESIEKDINNSLTEANLSKKLLNFVTKKVVSEPKKYSNMTPEEAFKLIIILNNESEKRCPQPE